MGKVLGVQIGDKHTLKDWQPWLDVDQPWFPGSKDI